MTKTFKERRLDRAIEQFGDLDEEQQLNFMATIQGRQANDIVKEVRMSATTSFGDSYDEVVARQPFFNKAEGMMSGLEYFDDATMGFRPGEVTVLSGPSNFGKTAVGLNLLANVVTVNPGTNAVIISLEMTTQEIFSRMYNIIPIEAHDAMRLNLVVQNERRIPAAYINRIIQKSKPDIVLIDHLQLLAMRESGDEYERITKSMAAIKDLALAHSVPIILISHVSKARSGSSGEATAADMKGSSAIEQDADIVMMINRTKGSTGDEIVVTLAKHRTKKPEVFYKKCVLKFDGIKIVNHGAYWLYGEPPKPKRVPF